MFHTFKQWRVKRKLRKLMATQVAPDIAMQAQPLTINPNKEQKLYRSAGRLFRLMYAIENGDERQSLIDEMPKHIARIKEKHLPVPTTALEAELLYKQLGA